MDVVGHVVQLSSGHIREWSWREEGRVNRHLQKARFGAHKESGSAPASPNIRDNVGIIL